MPFSMTSGGTGDRRGAGSGGRELRRAAERRLGIQPGRRAIELRRQLAQIAAEHDARRGRQQTAVGLRHAVGRAAGTCRPACPSTPSSAAPRTSDRQKPLHLVEILRGMLVQDDQIGAQTLDSPVFLRVQQLPHQRQRRRSR